jgi:TetR/AcrR family transcriptional regulator, transcriptional repressor for nem operon
VRLLGHGQDIGDVRQDQGAEDLADDALAVLQGAFVMAVSTRDKRMLSAVAKTMKLMIEPGASLCCLG